MHFNDDNLVAPAPQQWQYAFITFPGDTGMTPQAATRLAAALDRHRYHFTRKETGLRLRTREDASGLLRGLAATGSSAAGTSASTSLRPGHSAVLRAWPSRTTCSAPTARPPSPQPAPRAARSALSCSSPP